MKDFRTLSNTERLLYRELYKKSFYHFVKDFWCEADPKPFIDGFLPQYYTEVFQYMCRRWIPISLPEIEVPTVTDEVDVIDVRQNKNNYNINVPPRHSKSMILNVLAGCWVWINAPVKVASVSHTQLLAGTMNLKRQKVINSERFKFFFPEIKLVINKAYSLINSEGGELYSINREAMTGYGFDIGVMDDLTNAQTAKRNMQEMADAISFYQNTLPSRINNINNYAIMNIQQRLAPGDISSFIASNPDLSKTYAFIVLPAQFERTTYVVCPISGKIKKFEAGEYLWPERFGDYQAIRAQVGEANWQTQYLQKPVASEDTIIKDYMIIEKPASEVPDISQADSVYASHDFPVKDKESSDFLGSVLGYRCGATLYIVDCLEKKMAFVKSVDYVKQLDQVYPGVIQIIEDKANGSPILQQLQEEVAGMQAFQPGTQSKTQRLESASVYLNSGNVVFVQSDYDRITNTFSLPEKLNLLKQRLLSFPYVTHDDVIDAFDMMVLFVFMDKRFMVYGRSFNDENLVSTDQISYDHSTVFFNKEGDIWKAAEIGVKYQELSELYVLKEVRFKASVDEGLAKLKKFAPDFNVFIDCSPTPSMVGISANKTFVEYTVCEDFDASVLQLNLLFGQKRVKIDKINVLTRSDIENFKFSKSKDETVKYMTEKDGFVACLRAAARYYGMTT